MDRDDRLFGIAFAVIDDLRSPATDRLGVIAIIAASAIAKDAVSFEHAREMTAQLKADIEETVGRMIAARKGFGE